MEARQLADGASRRTRVCACKRDDAVPLEGATFCVWPTRASEMRACSGADSEGRGGRRCCCARVEGYGAEGFCAPDRCDVVAAHLYDESRCD